MTHAEVRAFAARHGFRYPPPPKRDEPSKFGIVVAPIRPWMDPPVLDPKAPPAPIVGDARRGATSSDGSAPPDPHAPAPGDFAPEDGAELALA
jgi:hypothetical protein